MVRKLLPVFFAELINASSGVNNPLFTSIKRMASRTNLYLQILSEYGAGRKNIAATAGHSNLFILGMYFWFHSSDLIV
jgi:hypothetical protein